MSLTRPLLRPAMVIERAVLLSADGSVARAVAVAVGAWKRQGYVCVALHCGVRNGGDDLEGMRAEVMHQRRIDTALRGFGGVLDATLLCPRPGEVVDEDVPRPSRFARLIIEAAAAHRIDLLRSLMVARNHDAIEGAAIAGLRNVLVVAEGKAGAPSAPGLARPDFVVHAFGDVLPLIAPRDRKSVV